MPNYSNVNKVNVNNDQVNTIDHKDMIGAFDVLYVRFCQKFASRAEPTAENMILLNDAYKNIKVTNY